MKGVRPRWTPPSKPAQTFDDLMTEALGRADIERSNKLAKEHDALYARIKETLGEDVFRLLPNVRPDKERPLLHFVYHTHPFALALNDNLLNDTIHHGNLWLHDEQPNYMPPREYLIESRNQFFELLQERLHVWGDQ